MADFFKGLERIEEARERYAGHSFMAGLFAGKPDFSLLLTPKESPQEIAVWEEYRPRLEAFLTREVDPHEIERTAKIPDTTLKGLFALGAFAMKIPRQYGGLGFSHTNYGRALMLMASWSNILALTVAVPQSIGIAMPLLLFGSEEQRRAYLPIVAHEAVSAFALTESITGSDAEEALEPALEPESVQHPDTAGATSTRAAIAASIAWRGRAEAGIGWGADEGVGEVMSVVLDKVRQAPAAEAPDSRAIAPPLQ